MESEVVVAASKDQPDTYFIFRDNGIEIKVVRKGNDLLSRWNLRPEEKEYLMFNTPENG